MIAYSPEAEPARAYLLRGYNDIDIFVEDVSAQNSYVRLFSRILNGVAKVNQVFPLGDRKNVLDACANDQAPRTRKRLYIIDADQDLIQGRPSPPLQHLYRLEVYSSENLLLSERAVIEIGVECSTSESWHDVATRLSFRPLMERACHLLTPLFVVYALAEQFQLGVQTVKFPVQRLFAVPNDPSSLSRPLVRARILDLRKQIIAKVGRTTYVQARNTLISRLAQGGPDLSRYISGKSYLLPLLHHQLAHVVRFQGSLDMLKVRLAFHCELTIDPRLPTALERAAN